MTSINETLEKIKPFYPLLLLVIFSAIFFILGRFSALRGASEQVRVSYTPSTQTSSAINSGVVVEKEVEQTATSSGNVIGSKSGKKYYFPWCGTVKRIKPENQVHFATIEEAKKAGFTPGGNCKGLW